MERLSLKVKFMSADEVKKKPSKASSKKGSSKGEVDQTPIEAVSPRLLEDYKNRIAGNLQTEFKFKTTMQVPRLKKIVVNCGLGKATQNIKIIDQAMKDIAAITGQKPVAPKSKKAISNFKLRAGLPIGVMVTLRGRRMYEFLDRLLSLAFPRIKDFRGVSDKGFDGQGNYTLGLKEHLVFPEVEFDTAESTFGMNITFVTSAKTDSEGRALLTQFGFPFRKKNTQQKAA